MTGAPPGNVNAGRHGARMRPSLLGTFGKKFQGATQKGRRLRLVLESYVLSRQGTISIGAALTIDEAVKQETVSCIVQSLLRRAEDQDGQKDHGLAADVPARNLEA